MKALIHFEHADGTEDSIIISGDTVEEVRSLADAELAKRGGKNPWSEELES
jgi:hypothetical protein